MSTLATTWTRDDIKEVPTVNNINIVTDNTFGNSEMFAKELEARKNNLRETFSKCDVVKLENNADPTVFIVSRQPGASDTFKVFCMVDNVPWSNREDTLENLVDYFAKSNYSITGKIEIDLQKDILRASFVNKNALTNELMSHRMDWSGVDTKEKQRIQKVVGRARDKIRENGVNWMSLRNVAMITVDNRGNITLAPLTNDDFARMCKSAARSWSDTEKQAYVDAMLAIKAELIVPENGIAPTGVYLAKYRGSEDIRVETGKDVLFNAKFRMQSPDKVQQIGTVYNKEGTNAQYIDSTIYLGDKMHKLHEETFEELMSAAIRQPTEQERAIVDTVKENQPEMIDALSPNSVRDIVKNIDRGSARDDR